MPPAHPPLSPRSVALLLATAAASWYWMMAVHESGHVLAASLTGGRVSRVVLHPLAFSRTDLAANPRPLLVAAAGTAWGSTLPLALWLIARAAKARLAFLLRAFAGFCLVANGGYLASAALLPVGDAQDLLRLNVPRWLLTTLGLATLASGLRLWHGLGPHFGFNNHPIDRAALVVTLTALILIFLAMLAWSHRFS